MKMKQTIKSLADYKKIFEDYFKVDKVNYKNERWIFRGQCAKFDNLKTKLSRCHSGINGKQHKKQVDLFRKLMNASKIKAPYDKPVLQLGQHYGLETNLLDWTIDPIIALFFPLTDNNKLKESKYKVRIFALKVYSEMVDLSQKKIKEIKDKDSDKKHWISIYDPLNLLNWNKFNYQYSNLLEINENMKKQKGLFTYRNIIGYNILAHIAHIKGKGFNEERITIEKSYQEHQEQIINSIKCEYPELIHTDWYIRKACEEANVEIQTKAELRVVCKKINAQLKTAKKVRKRKKR